MRVFDVDGSGTIDFDAFKKLASDKLEGEQSLDENEVRDLFNFFDVNNDGLLTHDELYHVLNKKMKLGLSRRYVDDMVKYCDPMGRGGITFEDFFHLLATKEDATPRNAPLETSKTSRSTRSRAPTTQRTQKTQMRRKGTIKRA